MNILFLKLLLVVILLLFFLFLDFSELFVVTSGDFCQQPSAGKLIIVNVYVELDIFVYINSD